MIFRTMNWINLQEMGFDWIWFLSVWKTGELGRKISRENPEWRHEFEETLTGSV